jgi:predicted ATPase/DNA-binding SARP family transcriptional activator
MPHLRLYFLGGYHVTLDGAPVTVFESNKVRALLAYLALESDHPHRREKLAGLLWPELPERLARHNLSQALFNLRIAIGDRQANPPFLIITPKTLQFNRSSYHWLDVADFVESIARCEQHRHRRLLACDDCLEQLEVAASFYRGTFLEGFFLEGCQEFDEWTLIEKEHLVRQTTDLLGKLVDCYQQRGDEDRMLEYARRWVTLDPWHEAAHRGVMSALVLKGQRGVALKQYKCCRRTLAEELGIEPEDETTLLYERIRDGEDIRIQTPTPPDNLDAPLTPFVGREAELAEIKKRLADPDTRLLSLVGPGGCGKTRLALEAAAALLRHFNDGAFFVPLAPLNSIENIIPAIAQALDFIFHQKDEPEQQLLDYLRKKDMLLILDNFEHLLGGVGWVTKALKTAPNVTIVSTSRERLNLKYENIYPVYGMDYPALDLSTSLRISPGLEEASPEKGTSGEFYTATEEDDLTHYDAIRLFLSAARRVRSNFKATMDDLVAITHISQLVAGMPLGILLAAAQLDILSPAEVAREIRKGFDFLKADLHDLPERQRGMRVVFDHSWRLLNEHEREVLRECSVFRGGFTRQAAQEVCGASLTELRFLVNKSLLQSDPHGRFGVHELLRQYVLEKLDRAPKTAEMVRNHHSTYYAAALEAWAEDLKGWRQCVALEEMEIDIENARSAWDWAVERGQVERLGQALDGLCMFFQWQGRNQEGGTICRLAAGKLMQAGDQAPRCKENGPMGTMRLQVRDLLVLGRILSWQSVFYQKLGRAEQARQLALKSLAFIRQASLTEEDTRPEEAFTQMQIGRTVMGTDREEARRHHENSLELYQAIEDRWGMAEALDALGNVAWTLDPYTEVIPIFEWELALRKELGDEKGMADALCMIGHTYARMGQFDKGVRLADESINIYQKLGVKAGIAYGLGELAMSLLISGRYVEALSLYEQSRAIRNELGMYRFTHLDTMALSHVEMHLGRYEQARKLAEEALILAQERDDLRIIGLSNWVLGGIALTREAFNEAQQTLTEGLSASRTFGQRDEIGRILATLGYALRGLGESSEAKRYFFEALRLGDQIQAIIPLLVALPGVALKLVDSHQEERAVEIFALLASYPFITNSRWFEDIAGKYIAQIAAGLPPNVVVAAEAKTRGRDRDLRATVKELLIELVD